MHHRAPRFWVNQVKLGQAKIQVAGGGCAVFLCIAFSLDQQARKKVRSGDMQDLSAFAYNWCAITSAHIPRGSASPMAKSNWWARKMDSVSSEWRGEIKTEYLRNYSKLSHSLNRLLYLP